MILLYSIITSITVSLIIGFTVKIKFNLDLNKLINDIIINIKYPFIFLYKRFYIRYKIYPKLEYDKNCIKCNHTGVLNLSEPSVYYDKIEDKMIRECPDCGYTWRETSLNKFDKGIC